MQILASGLGSASFCYLFGGEILAAVFGTFAFSVLFGAPGKYYPYCGIIGGCSWIAYLFFERFGTVLASLAATVFVVLLSRIMAIRGVVR